ncbi:MAG: DUF58 domain-containing protein [Gaiellales bacterium]
MFAAGVGLYVAARGFGAPVLGVLGVAFMVGPLVALALCLRYRSADLRLVARVTPARPIEGRPWACDLAVEGRLPRAAALELEVLGRSASVALRADAGAARGRIAGIAGRRGRHRLVGGRVRIGDPLGFARVERPVAGAGEFVVWLDADRVDVPGQGGVGGEGRRHGVRVRGTGYDLHGIREHQPGESLRRVDWKTSARAGALMVRELEDAGRVEVLVVADPGAAGGAAAALAVDAALRRSAAIATALNRGDAGAVLAVEEERRVRVLLDGTATARSLALDALSCAESGRGDDLAARLERCPDARAARTIVVVTAEPTPALADWAARAGRRGTVEVVAVGADEAAAAAEGA